MLVVGSLQLKFSMRPVNVFKLPPCNNQCPAGENIQQWLFYAAEGDYEHAWRILTEENQCGFLKMLLDQG